MTRNATLEISDRLPKGQSAKTVERIIDATFTVLSKSGAKRLSFAEVAQEAGISRPTLYRHFPTKEALLESLCFYMIQRFQAGLTQAIAANPSPDNRLDIVCEVINGRQEMQKAAQLLEVDPGFALDFFRQQKPHIRNPIIEALGPVFDQVEAEIGQPINRELVTDILSRLEFTLIVDPLDDGPQGGGPLMAGVVRALLREIIRVKGPKAN